jgi:hypothetical protein
VEDGTQVRISFHGILDQHYGKEEGSSMANYASMIQMSSAGTRVVGVWDDISRRPVEVEVGDEWEVFFGFPWWWSRLAIPKAINGVTVYPRIGLRATPGSRFTLKGFFHERFGHGEDQQEYAAKYWDWVWIVRYYWRMIWAGFSYHGMVDERTADGVAERMYAYWVREGMPPLVTMAMAQRWIKSPNLMDA